MVRRVRALFFVEGFTDIRFVTGLSEICDLTMAVPARQYSESGLKDRIAGSGAKIEVTEIPGNRIQFQVRSFLWLLRSAGNFDVIISQEVLRGSANASLVGAIKGVPVLTYMGISPIEYFRCRRERAQISATKAGIGEAFISMLMHWNGRLATRCLTMGPYLQNVASQYGPRTASALYYGVDTNFFRPADENERRELRRKRGLPLDRFIIFFASRISHEKDPETVLQAVSLARQAGLDAVVLNLSGGFQQFLSLAKTMNLPRANEWVLARPAAHPIIDVADYFRAVDVVVQASLAEGLGISPLEALASGTPVVATAVGGMRKHLQGLARLTPRRDAQAMANELLWIAANPVEARAQALRARRYVCDHWSRERAFSQLNELMRQAIEEARNGSLRR